MHFYQTTTTEGGKKRQRWLAAATIGVASVTNVTGFTSPFDNQCKGAMFHSATGRNARQQPHRKHQLGVLFDSRTPLDVSSETERAKILQDTPSYDEPRTNPKKSTGFADDDESSSISSSQLLMNPLEFFDSENTYDESNDATPSVSEYQKGLLTVGFITFLFATNSPVLHGAFTGSHPPPVLLVNAAVSLVALVGLLFSGENPNSIAKPEATGIQKLYGGLELGAWKFMGTTANLYGLAFTTASHGALLIQLTTLIVPLSRGVFYQEQIPTKLKASIGLALAGVLCFSQDPTGTPSLLGDGLCVLAAFCYSAYDLRLYEYGKVVEAKGLITNKIAFQAILSVLLLCLAPSVGLSATATTTMSWQESLEYLKLFSFDGSWLPVVAAIVWSGVAVNAVAPVLQVGGQQIVGPTKCQTIYASQPLWAAMLSFVFLGESLGTSGMIGGGAFLAALALAATTSVGNEDATATVNTTFVESDIKI